MVCSTSDKLCNYLCHKVDCKYSNGYQLYLDLKVIAVIIYYLMFPGNFTPHAYFVGKTSVQDPTLLLCLVSSKLTALWGLLSSLLCTLSIHSAHLMHVLHIQ